MSPDYIMKLLMGTAQLPQVSLGDLIAQQDISSPAYRDVGKLGQYVTPTPEIQPDVPQRMNNNAYDPLNAWNPSLKELMDGLAPPSMMEPETEKDGIIQISDDKNWQVIPRDGYDLHIYKGPKAKEGEDWKGPYIEYLKKHNSFGGQWNLTNPEGDRTTDFDGHPAIRVPKKTQPPPAQPTS